ncbi:MAG: sulfotransferase [Rhodospirillales bacterium]|nr:sulfotransferase [Rhodospirillales bacterium]
MTSEFNGPDFLGIGMERAGTSWLFTQLAAHPEIWVPPLKELHFFDLYDPQAFFLKHRYHYHLKSRLKQKAAAFYRIPHRPEFYKNSFGDYLLWDWRYFTGAYDLERYKSLFDPRFTKGRICGEITPAYSNLSPNSIRSILQMNPRIKFILMVRNPQERLTSGLIHYFRHIEKREMSSVSDTEMLRYLEGSAAQNRSDLVSILTTWQNAAPAAQICLQPFELIRSNPEQLLATVYRFLDVAEEFRPPESLYNRKINAYSEKETLLPEPVRRFIQDSSVPVLEKLQQIAPDIVQHWKV